MGQLKQKRGREEERLERGADVVIDAYPLRPKLDRAPYFSWFTFLKDAGRICGRLLGGLFSFSLVSNDLSLSESFLLPFIC